MKYENLITQLCEVIKESEKNAVEIYDNLESISTILENLNLPLHESKKIESLLSDSYGLIQHQDLHRQKIERVVNAVCEHNNIDASKYNIAPSAKHIDGDANDDLVSEDELEALIKEMQEA
ncbi:MAG: hypothetical protein MJK08_10335 [Campylobacterales bacterium]|nr:hypothetical protein [Campylobacterales bacterium]